MDKSLEGSECEKYMFYHAGGISSLNTGKLKQVAMAVYKNSMR